MLHAFLLLLLGGVLNDLKLCLLLALQLVVDDLDAGLLRCQVRGYLLPSDYSTYVVTADVQELLRVLYGLLLGGY